MVLMDIVTTYTTYVILEVDKSQIEEAITIEKEIIFEEDCEILIEER